MVCYYFLLREDPSSLLQRLKPTLSENLIRESNKFLKVHDQLLFLLGRKLLLEGLSDFGLPADLEELKRTKWGKPYLDFDFHFSISHSKDIVAVLFSFDCPVGIDIQYHEKIDWQSYAYLLSKREINQIRRAKERLKVFYGIWTKKEAIIKADGRGMEIMGEIDTYCLDPKWIVNAVHFHSNYSAHVCSAGADKLSLHLKQF